MDLNLITNRRHDIEEERSRLMARLAELDIEATDLDTAERVFLRLTGAERPIARPANRPMPARVGQTLPQMIERVLFDEHRHDSHFEGVEPKEMLRLLTERFPGVEFRSEAVSSIVWRMWKRGQLAKNEQTALYSLASPPRFAGEAPKEKPADNVSSGEQSTGLSDSPTRDGKPVREVEHDNSVSG